MAEYRAIVDEETGEELDWQNQPLRRQRGSTPRPMPRTSPLSFGGISEMYINMARVAANRINTVAAGNEPSSSTSAYSEPEGAAGGGPTPRDDHTSGFSERLRLAATRTYVPIEPRPETKAERKVWRKMLREKWHNKQAEVENSFFFRFETLSINELEVGLQQRRRMGVLRQYFKDNKLPDMERSPWKCFWRNSAPDPIVAAALETAKIKLEMKSTKFSDLPSFRIPMIALEVPIHVTVLGFDKRGYVYVRFHDDVVETEFQELMMMLEQVYSHAQERVLAMDVSMFSPGDVVVAKIEDTTGTGKPSYIRAIILKILRAKKSMKLLNIDDQKQHFIGFSEIYRIFDHFIEFPRMAVKCSMRFLELFVGYTTIPDAANLCRTVSAEVYGKVDWDTSNFSYPEIELYRDQEEAKKDTWSYNFDLLEVILNYNADPLPLIQGITIWNTKITNVNQNGEVWIQLKSGLMKNIANLEPLMSLHDVSVGFLKNKIKQHLSGGFRKFVMYTTTDQMYYRVELLALLDSVDSEGRREILVLLTDFGSRVVACIDNLIPIDLFGSEFEEIPAQGFYAMLSSGDSNKVRLTQMDMKYLIQTEIKQETTIFERSSDSSELPGVIVCFMMPDKQGKTLKDGQEEMTTSKQLSEDPEPVKTEEKWEQEEATATTFKQGLLNQQPVQKPDNSWRRDRVDFCFPSDVPLPERGFPRTAFRYTYRGELQGIPHWDYLDDMRAEDSSDDSD